MTTEQEIRVMVDRLTGVNALTLVRELTLLLAREVDQLRDQVQDHFHIKEDDL